MKNLYFLLLLAALGAAVASVSFTGCSTSHSDERSSGRAADDEEIQDHVKDRLRHEPTYKFSDVDVKTFNGVVQLSGFVNTEEQKQRAGELAQQTAGVAQVINNITLKPQVPSTPTGRAQ